jgi:L-ascorbate metabolism protein UlaG (beta-lactamase superfamily)
MRRLGFSILASIAAAGLAVSADTIPATGGNIEVTPIVHASTVIEHAGKVIHVDPWSQGSDYSKTKPADLILITDIHGDHMDAAAVDKVKKAGTVIVGPAAVAEAGKIPGVQTIANGETKTFAGITVEAVPMYNLQRGPEAGKLFHTKGRGNGYVVTVGGKRLYFAGDTECTPEMKALKNIDVAFIPMNLPYTMPPSEAAECVAAFAPKIVYPYHYRGSKVEEFTAALAGKGVEVRALNWYPAAK